MLAILGLGFALGVRHAFDADHVAAVSTLVARSRGVRASSIAGAVWGLGHTVALVVVALAVVMLDLRPAPGFVPLLELAVAAMLIVLGVDLLRRRVPGTDTTTARVRPFLVGMVHGLAGSAGLMIVVAATIAERWLALAYAGAFGAGTVAGMAVASAALSVPLGRLPQALGTSAALASITIGALLAWDVGRTTGWLT